MREVGPEDLQALGRALEPSAEEVERHVQRAFDRPVTRVRARRWAAFSRDWRALAAACLLALGAWGLYDPRPIPVQPTSAWHDLRPGLAVTGGGEGSLRGERIAWEQGKLVVSLEPGTGPLEVVTDLARVEVKGTVFSVDRGPFGTLVEVSRGRVEVTCTSGQQSSLEKGDAAACTPDAPSALALATALDAEGRPPEVVLAAVAAGLPSTTGPVEQSLRGLQVATHLRAGDLFAANQAAAALDPSLPAGRQALQRLVAATEACEPVQAALRALAPTDPAAAVRLARCTEDPAEAAQILREARQHASPEAQVVLDQWLEALANPR